MYRILSNKNEIPGSASVEELGQSETNRPKTATPIVARVVLKIPNNSTRYRIQSINFVLVELSQG